MDQFAIISTGGKQYAVTTGQKLKVEKLSGEVGETVTFDEVLLTGGASTKVGTPLVAGAKVTATVLRQARDKKKLVYKYHSKNRYDKKKGHRQHFTEVRIESL
jgi:large subunit ribosomal protein L21